MPVKHQSVENARVAFVKGADDGNKFFEEKKTVSNVWRTSAGEHDKGITISGTNWFGRWTPPENWPPCITIHVGISGAVASLLRQVTKLGVSFRQYNDVAVIDIFNEKRKNCNHRCPDSVYFHTLLLIIYLSAIEWLICRREMSLIGSTFLSFAQNTMQDFQSTVLNS